MKRGLGDPASKFNPEWEVASVLDAAAKVSAKKRQDYAGSDPDENFIRAIAFSDDVCVGLAALDPRRTTATLIGVKLARLRNLGLNTKARNESVDDTLEDLINYVALLKRQNMRARAGSLPGA